MRLLKLVVLVVVVAAVPAAAQEPPLPPDAVARVGTEILPRSEFEAWLRPLARSQRVDPPRFERCIAALAELTAKRTPRPTRSQLRERCRQRARNMRGEVLVFLIQGAWVRHEAAARHIVVTLPQAARELQRQKRLAFESEREYRRFLRASGSSEAQLIYRVLLSLLQERITEQVAQSAPKVTAEDVRRYYVNHRGAYRDVSRRRAWRSIRRQLIAARQMRAIDRFTTKFRARYRAITVCAPGYVVDECSALSARSRSPGSP